MDVYVLSSSGLGVQIIGQIMYILWPQFLSHKIG